MRPPRDGLIGAMFRRGFVPALCSAVGLALSDMADAIVMGRRMGETGLAAIGMSLPLYMVINICMHGFGIGGSVRYAKLMSEGRREEANRSFNSVMRAALLCSLCIAAIINLLPQPILALMGTVPADGELYTATLHYVRIIALGAPLFFLSYMLNYYLRNDDSAGIASLGMLIGNGVDIALNLLFVIVFGWGTAGAGWATLLGLAVGVICYAPTFRKQDTGLTILWKPMKIDWRETLRLFRAGFSTSCQYLWQMVFLLLANNMLMRHMGGMGVAIFDMLQNAGYLILYVFDAAVKAMQPLVTTFLGEKDLPAARRARRMAMGWGLTAGFAVILLLFVFPQAACTLFGLTDAHILDHASVALRIYCLGSLFAGVLVITEGYCQALEDERSAMLITTLRGGAVLIPVTLALGLLWPDGFWTLFPITEGLSLLLYLAWRRLRPAPCSVSASPVYTSTIRNSTDNLGALTADIASFCEAHQASARQQYFVTMTVEEICLAIMQKGFISQGSGIIRLTLIALEDGQFELHIRDDAVSFNPFSLSSGKVGEGDFDLGGMGMAVIKKQAKYFFYRRYQGFNTLTVRI